MISAPMTPGIQPKSVRIKTIVMEPQPRSITASGGKMMANSTWRQDIVYRVFIVVINSSGLEAVFVGDVCKDLFALCVPPRGCYVNVHLFFFY